jgi:SIR2-like domain/CHAT domain
VDCEVDRVNQELGSFDVTLLSSVGPASLNGIIEALRSREGGYDILYLVCHGACVEGEPRLWLEKANGQAAIVSGVTLADRLAELTDRPRLVILASCESAGTGDDAGASVDGTLAAIGPRLARAGIPAVVAMQGRVTMATLGEFFPEFFRTLRGEGQIDLAMARARSGIQNRRDSWMPVLFMRSNTGRLWAQPGLRPLEGETSAFESWEGILDHIENGQCTPILGSGLTDELFGTHQEIARRWADLFRYPLADHDRVDLPQVAQFLATTLSPVNARNELKAYLHRELLERFGDKVPNLRRDGELWNLIAEVGRWRRQLDPAEPHRVLAGLRCPVYLTTNPDRLLVDALKEEGVEPLQRMFDWRSPNPIADPLPDEGEEPWPNASHPLVYHLFGSYMPQPKTKKPDPRGLVLSQDDYFQHLIAMVRNKTVIPTPVSEALTNSSLMFVGFQLNDWTFRILLQVIREREGSCALEEYCHVAVQVDPEAGEFQDPEMARRYLEKIGKFNERVAIYWGSSADFLKELQSRRAKRHQTVGSLV